MPRTAGEAEPVWALGAMSGTSLDGVDAALVLTDGETIYDFGPTAYRPYSAAERATIRAALGRWPGEEGVEAAAEVVETAHAELLAPLARKADVVGFHGQTLAHDPHGRGTHQAGSGLIMAEVLGRPVVWDFRSSDIEMGGEGAPLAPFYHFACVAHTGANAPVAFINLGGVGNVTYVDPRKAAPEEEGACLAFDTGPANAPVNDLMEARLGLSRDDGGRLAGEGTPDAGVLLEFMKHPWFMRLPPKSLDRGDFADLLDKVAGLSDADAAATLTATAAAAVAKAFDHFPTPVSRLLVTGGGRLNATLMGMIAGVAPVPVLPVEDVGLNGDMLEAQAFAHLAVRVLRGLPTSCPGTTGVSAAVGGGQISRPALSGAGVGRIGRH